MKACRKSFRNFLTARQYIKKVKNESKYKAKIIKFLGM